MPDINSDFKIGDRVVFDTWVKPSTKKTGVVISITKHEHPHWGNKITIQPDEPIEYYYGTIWRTEPGNEDFESCFHVEDPTDVTHE